MYYHHLECIKPLLRCTSSSTKAIISTADITSYTVIRTSRFYCILTYKYDYYEYGYNYQRFVIFLTAFSASTTFYIKLNLRKRVRASERVNASLHQSYEGLCYLVTPSTPVALTDHFRCINLATPIIIL